MCVPRESSPHARRGPQSEVRPRAFFDIPCCARIKNGLVADMRRRQTDRGIRDLSPCDSPPPPFCDTAGFARSCTTPAVLRSPAYGELPTSATVRCGPGTAGRERGHGAVEDRENAGAAAPGLPLWSPVPVRLPAGRARNRSPDGFQCIRAAAIAPVVRCAGGGGGGTAVRGARKWRKPAPGATVHEFAGRMRDPARMPFRVLPLSADEQGAETHRSQAASTAPITGARDPTLPRLGRPRPIPHVPTDFRRPGERRMPGWRRGAMSPRAERENGMRCTRTSRRFTRPSTAPGQARPASGALPVPAHLSRHDGECRAGESRSLAPGRSDGNVAHRAPSGAAMNYTRFALD